MIITMDDVESAIKILNEYMRQSKRVAVTLKRLELSSGQGQNRMPNSMEGFMNMAYQSIQQKKQADGQTEQDAQIDEPSEKDLERMKLIKEKLT